MSLVTKQHIENIRQNDLWIVYKNTYISLSLRNKDRDLESP